MDIVFRSAGDDDFEPRSVCSRGSQNLEEGWATPIIATFVKCVNDKDESMPWVARNRADEIKEQEIPHRLWCQIWVVTKPFCHDISKRREDSRECVDESRKDVSGLAQVHVISTAEECASKLLPIVKTRTDRMSKCCFSDSR